MERIAMGMYIIMIGALDGRETCMQIVCDFPHVVYGYVAWHHPVQLISQLGSIELAVIIKMGNHQMGMDAGIGATGSHHLDDTSQQCGQSFLKNLLDRYSIRLYLPTMIGGSVKTKINKISTHHLECKVRQNMRYTQMINT